ncbi:unnamed protein product, partial [Brassica oleracea]
MPSSIRSSIKTALTLVEAILTHRKNNRVNWIPRHTGSTPPGFQRAPSDKKKKKKKERTIIINLHQPPLPSFSIISSGISLR